VSVTRTRVTVSNILVDRIDHKWTYTKRLNYWTLSGQTAARARSDSYRTLKLSSEFIIGRKSQLKFVLQISSQFWVSFNVTTGWFVWIVVQRVKANCSTLLFSRTSITLTNASNYVVGLDKFHCSSCFPISNRLLSFSPHQTRPLHKSYWQHHFKRICIRRSLVHRFDEQFCYNIYENLFILSSISNIATDYQESRHNCQLPPFRDNLEMPCFVGKSFVTHVHWLTD